jgi:hypothetical protein
LSATQTKLVKVVPLRMWGDYFFLPVVAWLFGSVFVFSVSVATRRRGGGRLDFVVSMCYDVVIRETK